MTTTTTACFFFFFGCFFFDRLSDLGCVTERRAPETDVAAVERLAASAKTPVEKARLEGLAQRLQSGDEQVRQAAARETHAVKALQQAHPSLKDSGRTASDSRMKRRTAPSSKEAGGFQPLHASSADSSASSPGAGAAGNSNNAAAAATPAGPLRRMSFWQRRRGSMVVTGPRGEGPARPAEWDESWEVQCDLLGGADWDNPHPATEGHSLLSVKTKKFCVALGGPSTAALADGVVLEDWES